MSIEFFLLDEIQKLRTPFLDVSMPMISNCVILCFLISIGLFINPKTRSLGFGCLLALLISSLLCSGILKPLFSRVRPFLVQKSVNLLISKPLDYSFPSGHTSVSFAFVFALYFAKTNKAWVLAFVLACFIAFSRIFGSFFHVLTNVIPCWKERSEKYGFRMDFILDQLNSCVCFIL